MVTNADLPRIRQLYAGFHLYGIGGHKPYSLRFRPGFLRRRARPVICSTCLRNESPPSGRPVRGIWGQIFTVGVPRGVRAGRLAQRTAWRKLDDKFLPPAVGFPGVSAPLVGDGEARRANPVEEFEARFRQLVNALEYGVAPALSTVTDQATQDALSRLQSELGDAGLPCLRAVAAYLHLFPDTESAVVTRVEDALVSNDHERVVDGLSAILRLMQSERSTISEENTTMLVRQVSQSIMYRHITGLRNALNAMSNVVENHPACLADETEELTLRGLHALAGDTDPARGMANLSFEEKLGIRQASAHLAYILFMHYSRQGADIPDSIKVWRAICQSENEFAEIRNQWLPNP